MMKNTLFSLLFLFFHAPLISQPLANVDPTYGQNGVAAIDFASIYESCSTSVMQPDGKIILGGIFRQDGDNFKISLARLQTNGQPDPGFGTNGRRILSYDLTKGHNLRQILIQPDQKILVAFLLNVDNEEKRMLARLLPNGDLDTQFGNQGYYASPWPRGEIWTGCKVESDGKILAFGVNSELFDGLYYGRIISFRLLPSGKLDTTYNGNNYKVHRLLSVGAVRENSFSFVTTSGNRNVLYCTSQNPITSVTTRHLIKLKEDGTRDSTFGTNGLFTYSFPGVNTTTIGIHHGQNGRILLPGIHRINATDLQAPAIYGIKPNGGIDSTFGTNGIARFVYNPWPGTNNYIGVDLKSDAQNRIYLGHYGFTDLSTSRVFAVTRFLPDGQVDVSYGANGNLSTNFPGNPQKIYLDPADGLPILTGYGSLTNITNNDDMVALKVKSTQVSNQPLIHNNISLFPNPAQNGDRIWFQGLESREILLVDKMGRKIWPSRLDIQQEANGCSFSITGLSAGIYSIRVLSAQGTWSQTMKLLVNER